MNSSPPLLDRRAARHQATRREILDAAWRLARERGLTGWALKDLAEAVGMRAPSLYVYVDSKNDLYDALFADGYRQLEHAIEAAGLEQDDAGPTERLRRAGRMFVDFCAAEPARYQLLYLRTIPGFAPSESSYALALDVLRRTQDGLAAAGAGGPDDLDLWTALLTGIASQQISNDPGGTRWVQLVDDAVDMFLAARVGQPGRR